MKKKCVATDVQSDAIRFVCPDRDAFKQLFNRWDFEGWELEEVFTTEKDEVVADAVLLSKYSAENIIDDLASQNIVEK